ncbi:MAG: hypothetical protein WBC06_13685 [Chitinophagaceae bacterium]
MGKKEKQKKKKRKKEVGNNTYPAALSVTPTEAAPEITTSDSTINIYQQTPTEQMEVHAHTHTPRKKWTHYFWEFLMLFLAVSLGFYAENTREGILHKKEVKTQLNSMLSDLQSDIILFDSVTDRNSYGAKMADSLVELLHSDITNTTEIYFAARTVTANLGYYYTNSKSFDQLKSAGLLRYIKDKELLDSIGTYYTSFQWLANQIDLLRLKMDEIHKGNTRLFDSYVFQQMTMNIKIIAISGLGGRRTTISKPLVKPSLLSADVKDINSVSLNYHYYSTTIKFYIRNAIALQNRAKGLIELIKKEYRFD